MTEDKPSLAAESSGSPFADACHKLYKYCGAFAFAGVLAAALVYVFGFEIVNAHMLKAYNITAFSGPLVKYDYVVAGVSFLLCFVAFGIPTVITFYRIHEKPNYEMCFPGAIPASLHEFVRLLLLVFMSVAPLTLILHFFFPDDAMNWRPRVWYQSYKLWFSVILILLVICLAGLKRKPSDVLSTAWGAVLACVIGFPLTVCIAVKYINLDALWDCRVFFILVSTTWYFLLRIVPVVVHGEKRKGSKSKTWAVLIGGFMLFSLVLLATYVFAIGPYGNIPRIRGGGALVAGYVSVDLIKNGAAKEGGSDSDPIEGQLIDRTEAAVFLNVRNHGGGPPTVIEVPSQRISRITYWEHPDARIPAASPSEEDAERGGRSYGSSTDGIACESK